MKIKKMCNKKNSENISIDYSEIKDMTLADISKLFIEKYKDVLIVLKSKKPFYILTATDIIDNLVSHNDTYTFERYIEKFPKSIISVSTEKTVFEAYNLIRSNRIHHLVIVNENNEFECIINMNDFASFLTDIALKDEMTGLYNKRFFEFIIDKYKKSEIEIGIIFIDLDNFKALNDKYGHLFGDKVIKKTADIIKSSIRDIDFAFRFGGDEFVIVVVAKQNVLFKIVNRIKEKINKAVIENFNLQASIGYAHFPTEGDIQTVIDLADKRMYEEKKRKKSAVE
jgi:diguanylate cyclase (GGDEF)-like protein